MAELPRVAVVVINYDGRDITLQALASLSRTTYPRCDLVVVDNGSRDGSAEAIAARFPQVRQLRVEVNRGSALGYHAGLRWALEQGYDLVALANNDIEVQPELVAELVAAAQRHPRAGCIGPKCRFAGERDRLWSAGGVLRFRESITRERGFGERDRGQYDEDAEVDYVNGCFVLVRREAALAAGLWDPVFFICVDDADFCTRVKRAGWSCLYAHRAVLYHHVAYSTGGYTPARNLQIGRSSAIYARRYAGPLGWAAFLLAALAAAPIATLRELGRGNAAAPWAKLRGIARGLREPLPPPPRWPPDGPPPARELAPAAPPT
jgi:GT2 family glycosyltransferase